MNREDRKVLRGVAERWLKEEEDGGDSVTALERDTRSLTKLLAQVVEEWTEKCECGCFVKMRHK